MIVETVRILKRKDGYEKTESISPRYPNEEDYIVEAEGLKDFNAHQPLTINAVVTPKHRRYRLVKEVTQYIYEEI